MVVAIAVSTIILYFSHATFFDGSFGVAAAEEDGEDDAEEDVCIQTCATDPGCYTLAPENAFTTGDICCEASKSCYDCNAGYMWNDDTCVDIPFCVPFKDCDDHPGKCGEKLSDGCTNTLDCSDSCAAAELCCSGLCVDPVCSAHADCDDSDVCTDDACSDPGTCSASCSNDLIEVCIDGDGCCPDGCDDSDNDCDCEETCMSLGYDCGTHTVCGISTDCGSCVDPERCSVTGKCAVVSPVSVTIDEPRDGLEYTQGSFIQFHGFVLGGQPDYTYSWSSDKDGVFSVNLWANTNALSVNTHIITLTVTDNKGVSSSDSITLTVRPLGTLTAQIGMWQTEFVHGDMIFFGVDVTSGILPYTFVWNSNHEGDFSIEQGPTVNTGIPPWTPGTHTITFTVTDFPENTATDTIDITITEMTVRIMPQDGRHFVYSESVGFVAMVVGGVAPYAYSWISDLDGMIGAVDNFQRDDLQEGVHTITVTIADSSSPPRTITKTIHIQIDSPPVLTVAIDNPLDSLTFKQGEDVSFEGSSAGGVGPYEFIWR
ncbi:MAG: PKD domain-containing protein, partial [Candidatus Aenigmarchaeota archaeon]|nr:PKD domain-containing protein [Candidatus Aenigmarchaeota archaeon]